VRVKQRLLYLMMAYLAPVVFLLWYHTIRLRYAGGSFLRADPATRGSGIYVCWHQRLLTFGYTHRRQGARILISRSRDGEMFSYLVRALGFLPVRGSSHRGGGEAVRSLLSDLPSGRDIGITVDGPRGPSQVFKVGAVYLASRSGLPIVPFAVSYRRVWQFKSWDRFQLPCPFTWGVMRMAEPIAVPPDLDEAGLEEWRLRLERVLTAHTDETDRRLAELYRDGQRQRDA
jgi:hypothetical protein